MTPKQQKILELAKRNGTDSELLLIEEMDTLETKVDSAVSEVKSEVSAVKESFKEAVEEVKANVPNLDEVLKSIRGKDGEDSFVPGPQGEKGDKPVLGVDYELPKDGKDGRDGKDGLDGVDGVGADGKDGKDGKDGSPDNPGQIRDKLETLKGKDRLNVDAIEGLEELVKKEDRKQVVMFGGRKGSNEATFGFTIGDGSATLTTGQKGYVRMPYRGTITGWSIQAAGSSPTCTIDVWKVSSGTALPTVSNTIMGTKPALATGNAIASINLLNWNPKINANDIVGFNLDAVANATFINFVITYTKS